MKKPTEGKGIIRSGEKGTRFNFWCEGCREVHSINNTWTFNGDFKKPTFSPSILVQGTNKNSPTYFRCHSFIENGQIRYLDDCTHELKGKVIDLKPF